MLISKVGDHYYWSPGFSKIWAGQSSPEWKFPLLTSFIPWFSIFIPQPSFFLLFHLMIWYFRFLPGCLFLLICLPSRLSLLERRLFLPLLLQPTPLLQGLLYSWEKGWGIFLISLWFVCFFDLSLAPSLALGFLGTQECKQFEGRAYFPLIWLSLGF